MVYIKRTNSSQQRKHLAVMALGSERLRTSLILKESTHLLEHATETCSTMSVFANICYIILHFAHDCFAVQRRVSNSGIRERLGNLALAPKDIRKSSPGQKYLVSS